MALGPEATFWKNKFEALAVISEKQSKALAEALKIKNEALDMYAAQSASNSEMGREIVRLQAELQKLNPRPKFKVGQVVRLTGSNGGFFGYHKIKSWFPGSPFAQPGDRILYDFEPEHATGNSRYDGTGEQYLIAVTEGEIL
jgi:hypothetical protein